MRYYQKRKTVIKNNDTKICEKKHLRNSNIELLRVVAMFMIIIYHIILHTVTVQLTDPASLGRAGLDAFNHPVFYGRLLILNVCNTFGQISNGIFILISGYFMAGRGRRINIGNISKKLLLQLGFAAILLVCIPPVLYAYKSDIFVSMLNITVFNSMSWFVGYYFLVILCGWLFLNSFLKKLNKKEYVSFLFVLLIILLDYPRGLIDNLSDGLSRLIVGLFLYSLGGFIKKYEPFARIRTYVFYLVIILCNVLVMIGGYNVTQTNIENYYRKQSIETFIQTIPYFANHIIVVILVAICMFEIFRRIKLPDSKFMTFLGKGTFMVYLIHDNDFFYNIWNLCDWITTLSRSPMKFILNLLKWSLCTYVVGMLAYILYCIMMKIFEKGHTVFLKD